MSQFRIVGSPQVGFSRNLECLIEVNESDSLRKRMGYYVSLYGLLIVIGALFMLILIQIICYFFGKYIKNREILIQYIFCSILCFILFIQPGMVLNSLDYLKSRKVNGIDYCFANTFIEMDTDFYKDEIQPTNIAVIIVIGILFPCLLGMVLVLGKKSDKLRKLDF